MIDIFVTDSAEALAAISVESEKNVWINGSQTVISTGEDYVAPVEVVTFLDVVVEEVVADTVAPVVVPVEVVKATVATKKPSKVVPVEVVADIVAPVMVPVEVVEPV
jgi:hypothetical protein